jgi:hypothetical protein
MIEENKGKNTINKRHLIEGKFLGIAVDEET